MELQDSPILSVIIKNIFYSWLEHQQVESKLKMIKAVLNLIFVRLKNLKNLVRG